MCFLVRQNAAWLYPLCWAYGGVITCKLGKEDPILFHKRFSGIRNRSTESQRLPTVGTQETYGKVVGTHSTVYCHHLRSKVFHLFLQLENSWLCCTFIEDRFQGDHVAMAWDEFISKRGGHGTPRWLLGYCTCKFQYCLAVTRYTLQNSDRDGKSNMRRSCPKYPWIHECVLSGVSRHCLGWRCKISCVR